MRGFVLSYLRLLRVPNLFTAPGDSLAGFFLAGLLTNGDMPYWRLYSLEALLFTACASILAYAFGILTNDLFDLKEDRAIRPERPLPSGAVPVWSAVLGAVVTALGSLLCSVMLFPRAAVADLLLLGTILLYNGGTKRLRMTGSAVMGLCRGFNVLLGLSACRTFAFTALAPSDWRLILPCYVPAIAVTVNIAAVTWIADGENRTQRLSLQAFIPATAAIFGWLAVLPTVFLDSAVRSSVQGFCLSMASIALAVSMMFRTGLKLFHQNAPPSLTQPCIGAFIRALIPWQLSLIFLNGQFHAMVAGCLLLLAWFFSRRLAKHFMQS